MTSAQRFGLPAWLRKARELEGVNGPPQDSFPRTELANAFRLEALEPRLLLSADPIVGEAARWIEDQTGQDADALAAIVQEINLATESQLTAGLASDATAPAGSAVAWPESWSAAGDASAPNALPNATGAAEAQVESGGDVVLTVAENALVAANGGASEDATEEPRTLNQAIDALLEENAEALDQATGPLQFTLDEHITVGEHYGGHDLVLTGTITLTFEVARDANGDWTGTVTVSSTGAHFLTGSANLTVIDSTDDDDLAAVTGTIHLASANESNLELDEITTNTDQSVLTASLTEVLPDLLRDGISLSDVTLTFENFRDNDDNNALVFKLTVAAAREFGEDEMEFDGFVELEIQLDEFEDKSSGLSAPDSLAALFNEVQSVGETVAVNEVQVSVEGSLQGSEFQGNLAFSYVPSGIGEEKIAVYAVAGSISIADEGLNVAVGENRLEDGTGPAGGASNSDADQGSGGLDVSFAFAFSDLGPIEAFFSVPEDLQDKLSVSGSNFLVKLTSFRIVFNNTIEGLQVDSDYMIERVEETATEGSEPQLTLVLAAAAGKELDLEEGDEIRLTGNDASAIVGILEIASVTENDDDTVTVTVGGLTNSEVERLVALNLVGSSVIRHNMKDPDDLDDPGLSAQPLVFLDGDDVDADDQLDKWLGQLATAVQQQIENDVDWGDLSGFIIGGTADIEFRSRAEAEVDGGISPETVKAEGEILVDSQGALLIGGTLIVGQGNELTDGSDLEDGLDVLEGTLYVAGELEAGVVGIDVLANAALVPDAEIGELKADLELVVDTVTGDVALMVDGTVDINIPGDVASFSVKGASELLLSPDDESDAYNIDFAFAAEVTEGEVGLLGEAEGRFLLTVGDGEFDIYGAADLTVNTDLFSGVGLDFSGATSLTGQIRLNTTGEQQTLDIPARDNELNVIDGEVSKSFDLTAEKIAVIRITG